MHRWIFGRTILSGSGPNGSTGIAVAEGPTSYVWLEEADMAGQPGKSTEPRYFGIYVTFSRLRNRWVTKYGDLLALGLGLCRVTRVTRVYYSTPNWSRVIFVYLVLGSKKVSNDYPLLTKQIELSNQLSMSTCLLPCFAIQNFCNKFYV